jgi:hypothetical protein
VLGRYGTTAGSERVVVHMPVGYEEIKKLQEMSGSGSLSDKV